MKRTHYKVKAQRARNAWKRLKERTQTKETDENITLGERPEEYRTPEMADDERFKEKLDLAG